MKLFISNFSSLYLLIALMISAWAIHKKRRRLHVFLIMTASLIYLGFLNDGCVCSVGSFQNVIHSFLDKSYILPLSVIAAFLFPIIAALLWGRVFCGGVCPLGAIQDLLNIIRIPIPKPVISALKIIPYAFLGIGIIFLINGFGFVVCSLDPFIPFFRLNGTTFSLILGISFLMGSMIIARPYCRFLCPYGVILSWVSRLAKHGVSITPSDCVHCTLCKNVCPVDAIHPPFEKEKNIKIFKWQIKALPILVISALLASLLIVFVTTKYSVSSKVSKNIIELQQEIDSLQNEKVKIGKSADEEAQEDLKDIDKDLKKDKEKIATLFEEKKSRQKVGLTVGIIMALLFTLNLMLRFLYKKNKGRFTVDKSDCVSCGRCYNHCASGPLPPMNLGKRIVAFERMLSHMAHRKVLTSTYKNILLSFSAASVIIAVMAGKMVFNDIKTVDDINLLRNKDLIQKRIYVKKHPESIQEYEAFEKDLSTRYLKAAKRQKVGISILLLSFFAFAFSVKTVRNSREPECGIDLDKKRKGLKVPEKKKHVFYKVNDNCIGCTKCAQKCPVGAIESIPYKKHIIDLSKCIRCDACVKVCPAEAIDKGEHEGHKHDHS